MSYHANPVINDLMLTVINDGDGSVCGHTYKARCDMARLKFRAAEYRIMAGNAGIARTRMGGSSPTREERIEAGKLLQQYYEEHVKEAQ